MEAFATVFERTNGVEGRYSNNAKDSGGETMWGITVKLARRYGYMGPMIDMPISEARRIAKAEFWDALNLDQVVLVSYPIAEELYDTRFNTGQCYLQVCLNRFNREQALYPDIDEDGNIGPKTIACLKAYMNTRGSHAERVMLRALNSLQGAYYFSISGLRKEKNEEFIFGWFDNRVEIS
jgi:lysozyme family protein